MAEPVRQSVVSKLRQAVWGGREKDLRRLLKKASVSEVNFVDQDYNGASILSVSALQGHFDIAKYLIGANAVVNQAKNNGATALFISAQKGHFDIVKHLIGAKAAVGQATNNGTTPLHVSAHGHFDILKTLIQHGADPTIEMQQGGQMYTAQLAATSNNHSEIAAYLGEATRATANLSPLHRECFRRYTDRLHALLRSDAVTSAMLDQPAPPGGTPVEIAEASEIRDTTIELLPVCERTL